MKVKTHLKIGLSFQDVTRGAQSALQTAGQTLNAAGRGIVQKASNPNFWTWPFKVK